MKSQLWKDLWRMGGIATLYLITARLGLGLEAVNGVATSVWPPTGIALAALLIYGYRFWPTIILASFLTNYMGNVPPWTALGISVGNTLEALTGAFLLRRFVGFRNSLDRVQDVFGLVLLAATCSTLVSATIGTGSAWLGGVIPSTNYFTAWWTWWIGDMMGDLIVAPVLLTWSVPPFPRFTFLRIAEGCTLLFLLIATCQITLGKWFPDLSTMYSHAYLLFPFMIWAALRFSPREASFTVLIGLGVILWDTIHGWGPFIRDTLHMSLLSLQTFMGIVATTTMFLAATVAQRKRAESQLAKANEDLQRISQIKSEFTSMVSHELKTPLTVIKGSIDMIIDGVDGPVTDSQTESLTMAKNNVDRLARLINNVLDYEKLESGKMEILLAKTNLNDLVQEIYRFMQVAARKKEIELKIDLPKIPVIALCDADKIKEVLMNLIDNSLKYSDKKGEVQIHLKSEGAGVCMEVEDSGIGIRKEDQQKIFEFFNRAPSSMPIKADGYGVGLAVCKLIIDRHKGHISVESDPGQGTKFKVWFPSKV